jgi:hypothetical protein
MTAVIAAIEAFMEQEAVQTTSRRINGLGAWRTAMWSAQPQPTFGAARSWRGIS